MSDRPFRRIRWASAALAAAALMTSASTASAQTTGALQTGNGFDLRLFRQAVDSKGLITLNGTDILGARGFSIGFMLDAGVGMGRIGNGGQALVGSMFSGNLSANFGIGNLLVVGAQIPFHLVSGPGNVPMEGMTSGAGPLGLDVGQYRPEGSGLSEQGLGNVTLHAKLRWLRAEYFPVGLAVILQAGIPTFSSSRNFAGEPGPWVWPSVAVERRFGRRVRLVGNLGARIPFASGSTLTPASGQGESVQYGPSLTFGLGFSYRLGTVIDLMAEAYGAQYVNAIGNSLALPVEGVAGAKIFIDRNSYLTLGAGSALNRGGLAAANVRAFVGITLEPSIGDTDGDGYRDDVDRCVNEPEDFDNFEDDDGCPDPDNDRDTIPDVRDQCPNDAEVFNGLDDTDGCPDNGVLRRVGTEIQLNQQINFATDSAQIIDSDTNRTIIEQMSALLNNTPDIELVEVEGHTDERAADDHNLQLSRDRANSVMAALVTRGVAATRLVAAGYGEFCPLDARSNEEAWARNRRVQFFIIRTAVDGRTTASAGCPRGRQYVPPSVGAPRRAEQ